MKPKAYQRVIRYFISPAPNDKRQREGLAGLTLAVVQVRTVNLAELALCTTGNAKPSSAYR